MTPPRESAQQKAWGPKFQAQSSPTLLYDLPHFMNLGCFLGTKNKDRTDRSDTRNDERAEADVWLWGCKCTYEVYLD